MRFVKVPEVLRMIGFSKNTLYVRIRAGTFPKPVAIGPRTTAFLEAEVLEWMESQIARGRGYSSPTAKKLASTRWNAMGGRNV
jgi:prophage regulatory protein